MNFSSKIIVDIIYHFVVVYFSWLKKQQQQKLQYIYSKWSPSSILSPSNLGRFESALTQRVTSRLKLITVAIPLSQISGMDKLINLGLKVKPKTILLFK